MSRVLDVRQREPHDAAVDDLFTRGEVFFRSVSVQKRFEELLEPQRVPAGDYTLGVLRRAPLGEFQQAADFNVGDDEQMDLLMKIKWK